MLVCMYFTGIDQSLWEISQKVIQEMRCRDGPQQTRAHIIGMVHSREKVEGKQNVSTNTQHNKTSQQYSSFISLNERPHIVMNPFASFVVSSVPQLPNVSIHTYHICPPPMRINSPHWKRNGAWKWKC